MNFNFFQKKNYPYFWPWTSCQFSLEKKSKGQEKH